MEEKLKHLVMSNNSIFNKCLAFLLLNGQDFYSKGGKWNKDNVACLYFWYSYRDVFSHSDLLSSFINAWWSFSLFSASDSVKASIQQL